MTMRGAVCGIACLSLLGFIVMADDRIPYKAKTFECTPRMLTKKSTLTMRISTPHACELGVVDPAGAFYFLMSGDSDLRADQLKDLECDAFVQLPEVKLTVSELRAPAAEAGYKESRRVFGLKGTYRFALSQNLETENTAGTINECTVTYSGK
jgi:hypothetical protein